MEAPKSGTKWHKDSEPKKWYEAVSEEGHTYFWHVETNGTLSLREQLFAKCPMAMFPTGVDSISSRAVNQ
jgi:hypothetical protein